MKTETVAVRLTPEDRRKVEETAARMGIKPGDLFRLAIDAVIADPQAVALHQIATTAGSIKGRYGLIRGLLMLLSRFARDIEPNERNDIANLIQSLGKPLASALADAATEARQTILN